MAAIFILVFGFLHLQPLFGRAVSNVDEEESCASVCQMNTPCGSKKDEPAEKENNCPIQACNPFVPCAMSACCYLVESFFPGINASVETKTRLFVFNDDRILNQSSECFHPPEYFS
jgi:hypothetical protein